VEHREAGTQFADQEHVEVAVPVVSKERCRVEYPVSAMPYAAAIPEKRDPS